MTLKPLADRVVVKAVEAEETTKTGIVLPGTAKEKHYTNAGKCDKMNKNRTAPLRSLQKKEGRLF